MITFSKFISESPQIVDSTDFDLNDNSKNRKLANNLINKKTKILEDNKEYKLFVTGDGINGYIILIDKNSGLIDYLSKYEKTKFKSIDGHFITQVKIWRRIGSIHVQGLTTKVFFDYYLKQYKAIMSDKLHTLDGKKFWMDQMAKAVKLNHKVGLIDMNTKKIDYFKSSYETFNGWLSKVENEGWGDEANKIAKRFVIFE